MPSENHTIATLTIDRGQVYDMALSRNRMIWSAVQRDPKTHKPVIDADTGRPIPIMTAALNRITEWIKLEDPKGYDPSNIRLGNDDDNFYLSYYGNGMLYRIMKDGRVRMESADATDMMKRQYDEFARLIDTIIIDELTARTASAIHNADTRVVVKGSRPVGKDENGLYSTRQLGLVHKPV